MGVSKWWLLALFTHIMALSLKGKKFCCDDSIVKCGNKLWSGMPVMEWRTIFVMLEISQHSIPLFWFIIQTAPLTWCNNYKESPMKRLFKQCINLWIQHMHVCFNMSCKFISYLLPSFNLWIHWIIRPQ